MYFLCIKISHKLHKHPQYSDGSLIKGKMILRMIIVLVA